MLANVFPEIDMETKDDTDSMYITVYKTKENIELAKETMQAPGGFNGSGAVKDNYSDKPTASKTD